MAVDDPYLTADQVVERRPRLGSVAFADLEKRVRQYEEIVEDYYQRAFTPRARTVQARYWRGCYLRLPSVDVTEITDVVIDSVHQPDLPLATITADRLGDLVYVPGTWALPVTQSAPTVSYVYGLPAPYETLLDGCAEYVESVSIARSSGVSRNVLSQAEDGGTTRYSTPNKAEGRPTGWLEVDRLINAIGSPISGLA